MTVNVKSFSERRWMALDPQTPQGVLAVVQEIKPYQVDPAQPTPEQLFNVSIPLQALTRAQLQDVKELLEASLTDAPASKILSVPPGTRLAP